MDQGYSTNELRSDDEYLDMKYWFPQPALEELDNVQDQSDEEAFQRRNFFVIYFKKSWTPNTIGLEL